MQFEQMKPANSIVEALWKPGDTVRPYGYFAAGTAFALKALELGLADNIVDALENFTAIPRKLMGNKKPVRVEGTNWMEAVKILQGKPSVVDHVALTDTIFAKYLSFPEASTYHIPPMESYNGRQVGAYTHDYDQDAQAIRLHFAERVRGPKSEFGSSNMEARRADLVAITRLINNKRYSPAPQTVTSGSWMYNIRSIINVMPETFRESAGPPPTLFLGGDSMWGQFVTSDGGYHAERYLEFVTNLKKAYDLPTMITSFPLPVLFLQGSFRDFLEYYQVE